MRFQNKSVLLEDIDAWIGSLKASERLQVFQALSEYLSISELKAVMSEVAKGRDLLSIHRQLGLINKYQIDLIRIKGVRIL